MVGMVSYLGRVKQGNYHTHVLYIIPNPNYTLPKPYPFIIIYPIHHPTLGTQTGRVLPCASINTTLPWIPTYPYPFRTKNELRLSNLSIQYCLKVISILCLFLNYEGCSGSMWNLLIKCSNIYIIFSFFF